MINLAHGLLVPQGQARPMEDKVVANTSLVRWMYLLRLAVETGQCDPKEWQQLRQLLVMPGKAVDLRGLYSTRDGIHAVLNGADGEPRPGGVFSMLTERKGELTRLIEHGHARLAKLNTLLRALWNDAAGLRSVSSQERKATLNHLVGVMVGESRLHPELALQLLSALGHCVIRRARASSEGVPQALPGDITNLRISSKGLMSEGDQQAAFTAMKLAALLRIKEAFDRRNGINLSAELAQRGSALQGELRVQIKNYREQKDPSQQVNDALGAAEDFIAELPPDASEHGPGNSQLNIMIYLLGAAMNG